MNLIDVQEVLEDYARDSNKDVRFYSKAALKILNDEEVDMESTLNSRNPKSIKSKKYHS
jgi:hypothetical protein